MATKKRPTGRKTSASARAKRHAGRDAGVDAHKAMALDAVQQYAQGYDIRDLLTNSLITSDIKPVRDGLSVQDILYNASPAMRQLAYKSGFSVGKEIYQKSGNSTGVLFGILEKAGFGKVLYYPFEDKLVIKTMGGGAEASKVNFNAHEYICGLIAGYMSAFTGMEINTAETECVYNNSQSCTFESKPGSGTYEGEGSLDLDSIAETISKNMGTDGGVQQDYYMLSMLPMTSEPLLGEVSKILYLSGIKLAQGVDAKDAHKVLRRMAKYFDMEDVRMAGRGAGKAMTLEYKPYNSTNQFVRLSSSMFAGFASGLYGSQLDMETKARNDKRYTVRLGLRANNK